MGVIARAAVLLAVLGLALGARQSAAVQLDPVALTGVSVELEVTAGVEVFVATPGTSSAVIASSFNSEGTFTGAFSADATVDSAGLLLNFSSSGVSGPGALAAVLTATFEFDVPELGGASTVLYADLDPIASQASFSFTQLFKFLLDPLHITSTSLGRDLELATPIFGPNTYPSLPHRAQVWVLPAGDRIAVELSWLLRRSTLGATSGNFTESHRLQFMAPPVAIATGDMDANGVVDLADVTILRRLLAGLPVN